MDELVDYVKENHVDGVIDFCIDPAQRPTQQIVEKSEESVFGTWESVMALTDKHVFKKLCHDTSVDIIPLIEQSIWERRQSSTQSL